MLFAFLNYFVFSNWYGTVFCSFGSEKDAQMCIYHVSWQSNFGFCCELDEECAREVAGQCMLLVSLCHICVNNCLLED